MRRCWKSRETWYFPDAIFQHEFRARPDELRMITIDGDSMEPVLGCGDRIILDTNQPVPVTPGIFVIWEGLGLVAKPVEHVTHCGSGGRPEPFFEQSRWAPCEAT